MNHNIIVISWSPSYYNKLEMRGKLDWMQETG